MIDELRMVAEGLGLVLLLTKLAVVILAHWALLFAIGVIGSIAFGRASWACEFRWPIGEGENNA